MNNDLLYSIFSSPNLVGEPIIVLQNEWESQVSKEVSSIECRIGPAAITDLQMKSYHKFQYKHEPMNRVGL